MLTRLVGPWLWAPAILLVDFVSKRLVLANETALRQKIEILGEFLRFIYVRNPGSAMGLFPVGRAVLVGVSLLATGVLVHLYRTTDPQLRVRRSASARSPSLVAAISSLPFSNRGAVTSSSPCARTSTCSPSSSSCCHSPGIDL